MEESILYEPSVAYNTLDDNSVYGLISLVRNGIRFPVFERFVALSPFSLPEWSSFLHLSERTIQRYKKESKTFDALQSERIVEIKLLYNYGSMVFGSSAAFNSWLDSENLALGKVKPKSLLDSSFGIGLLKDELGRIEHGVLA
jgi:putative toxin-antitoxin system antitoxin component (TIGR02293 family)